jgi:hypothetical protein
VKSPTGGFSYEVTDEQIATYSALPIDRRVRWVEELARTTFSLAPVSVRARWSTLRRGEPIGWRADVADEGEAPVRDDDFSRPYLPEPHYVMSAVIHGREHVLEVWQGTFAEIWSRDVVARLPDDSAARQLFEWCEGSDRGPSAWNDDPLMVHDVRGLADHVRAHPPAPGASRSDASPFASRLVEYLDRAADVGVPVRVTYV